jgi:hypothetical protein
VVARWQLLELGFGEEAIDHRLAAGRLHSMSGPVDVTIPRRSRSSKLIRRHLAALPGDEATVHDGIPVTTVPRTIFDLAACSSIDRVESAIRQAEYRRLNDWITVGEKRFQADCHWPGTGQVVELDSWEAHGTRFAFREDRARDRTLRIAG